MKAKRYFDTSALAKRYRKESGSVEVAGLLVGATPCTSRISEVELYSTVARWEREGRMTASECDRAFEAVQSDLRFIEVIEITPQVLRLVRRIVRTRGLRSGDALQLASCLRIMDQGGTPVEFVSDDTILSAAARAEHLPVIALVDRQRA